MELKHKPATPLPWTWLPDEGQFIVSHKRDIVAEVPCQGAEPQDGAYIVHACNEHPRLERERAKLVEALRSTLGALEESAQREQDSEMRFYAEKHHSSVVALLRELGESQ